MPPQTLKQGLQAALEKGLIDEFRAYERSYYYRAPLRDLEALEYQFKSKGAIGLPSESLSPDAVRDILDQEGCRYLLESIPQRITLFDDKIPPVPFGWTTRRFSTLSPVGKFIAMTWINAEKKIEDHRSSLVPLEGVAKDLVVRYLGAGREVGRSCNLIEVGEESILVDCGLGFGSRNTPYLDRLNTNGITGVYLTHAHYDHCAAVPYLTLKGYRGPIYCTKATLTRSYSVWMDYLRLTPTPLYGESEVTQALLQAVIIDPQSPLLNHHNATSVHLYPSGHMPGSVMIGFHTKIGGRVYRVLFTGDLGEVNTPYLCKWPKDTYNAIISQGTYGTSPYKEVLSRELEVLDRHLGQNSGKVLITSLELRAAYVYYNLCKFASTRKFWLPAGVREALLLDLEDVEWYKADLRQDVHDTLAAYDESLSPGDSYLMTPGMLQGGSSLTKLLELAPHEENTIVLTSFLPKGTVGRALLDNPRCIHLTPDRGREVTINCRAKVHHMKGYSAHASGETIRNFLKSLRPNLVLIQHGEASSLKALATALKKSGIKARIPDNLEAVRLA